jgi:hypothetical protein
VTLRTSLIASLVVGALVAAPLTAQEKKTTEASWYAYGQPIPDLNGPAPRLPNGKPSMAGMWSQTRRADVTNTRIPGYVPELPYTPWGKRQWDNYDPNKHGDYAGSCLPFGWSRTLYGPHPIEFVQDNDKLIMLAEQDTWFTIVFTDGRPFDKELPSTWNGDSVGHWEGDTLVIVTKNMNGYVKIDTIGHPLSSEVTITQTYKRLNFGTIEHTFTIDDPKTYTKPWTIHDTWPLEPINSKLLEYACMENNIDNLVNKVITPWHPPEGDDKP